MLCNRREGLSGQARCEQLFEEVRLMEALGDWCCWFAEHHFAGYTLMPDCLLMALRQRARPRASASASTWSCSPSSITRSAVAEDADEAHATFERGMTHYFGYLHRITTNAEAVQHDVYDRLPTTMRLSGSPAPVVQQLCQLVDYFDVSTIVNVTQFRG